MEENRADQGVHEACDDDLEDDRYTALKASSTTVWKSAPSKERQAEEVSEDELQTAGFRWNWLVIKEDTQFRRILGVVTAIMLLYIGTLFPYRLCFIIFRICDQEYEYHEPEGVTEAWETWDFIVDAFFWFDLAINFFLSYRKENGIEVLHLPKIINVYLRTYFLINLVSCLPPVVYEPIIKELDLSKGTCDPEGSAGSSMNKATRLVRLNEVTRLAKIFRLLRLSRVVKQRSLFTRLLLKLSKVFRVKNFHKLGDSRSLRILKWLALLAWTIHITACGWYLCASLHDNPQDTWASSRSVNNDGASMLTLGPEAQWLHAMYFVLTVFSTVGFGDISATTTGEIVFVMFTIILGAIVHSIIVSEMIGLVSAADETAQRIEDQQQLVGAFVKHAELDVPRVRCVRGKRKVEDPEPLLDSLTTWISWHARTEADEFDREGMKRLITTTSIPHRILKEMPLALFQGRLMQNRFMTNLSNHTRISPRLPMLLATSMTRQIFHHGDVVYSKHDHAFNMFIVLRGVLASCGIPRKLGGKDEAPTRPLGVGTNIFQSNALEEPAVTLQSTLDVKQAAASNLFPYKFYCFGNYFGDYEVFFHHPRKATVRCEIAAEVLVLHKLEFAEIVREFPAAGKMWRIKAMEREGCRLRHLSKLTQPAMHKQLAAALIQGQWRARGTQGHVKRSRTEQRSSSSSEAPVQSEQPQLRPHRAAVSQAQPADGLRQAPAASSSRAAGGTAAVDELPLARQIYDISQLGEEVERLHDNIENLREEVMSALLDIRSRLMQRQHDL